MKKHFVSVGAALATLAPSFALAQQTKDVKGFGELIINTINGVLTPVLFAIAFIVFLWGAFYTFILGANSEEVKEKGKNLMIYGLIGFVVMVSIWGLVNLLTGSLHFDNAPITYPSANGQVHP